MGRAGVEAEKGQASFVQQVANRTGIIRPDAASANPLTTLAYDVAGNLVQSTDALGRTTWRQYDALGRLKAETSPRGRLRRRPPASPAAAAMRGFAPRQSAERKLD